MKIDYLEKMYDMQFSYLKQNHDMRNMLYKINEEITDENITIYLKKEPIYNLITTDNKIVNIICNYYSNLNELNFEIRLYNSINIENKELFRILDIVFNDICQTDIKIISNDLFIIILDKKINLNKSVLFYLKKHNFEVIESRDKIKLVKFNHS